jgi:hypothetical protein
MYNYIKQEPHSQHLEAILHVALSHLKKLELNSLPVSLLRSPGFELPYRCHLGQHV